MSHYQRQTMASPSHSVEHFTLSQQTREAAHNHFRGISTFQITANKLSKSCVILNKIFYDTDSNKLEFCCGSFSCQYDINLYNSKLALVAVSVHFLDESLSLGPKFLDQHFDDNTG